MWLERKISSQQGFSPAVAPHITITVNNIGKDDDSDAYHEIVIADNGVGFDQQHAERIFTVFELLQKDIDVKGTGIGLAICKKVALNHGGGIFAVSQPGRGARFHVMLPAGPENGTVKKHSSFGENTV